MNKYKLLKPLLIYNDGSGCTYGAGTILYQNTDLPNWYYTPDGEGVLAKKVVENNPDWFQKIEPEERKEHFEVEKITEFGRDGNDNYGWKGSYQIRLSKAIESDKFPAIKSAIESVLNNDVEGKPVFDAEKINNQLARMEGIKEGFAAAKIETGTKIGDIEYFDGDKGEFYPRKYPTLEDYIKSLGEEKLDDKIVYKEPKYDAPPLNNLTMDEPGQWQTPNPISSRWVSEHSALQKGFEIVSFKVRSDVEGKFFTKHRNGLFSTDSRFFDWSEKQLLEGGYPIHSVKRLSDGACFHLGDMVGYDDGNTRTKQDWAIDNFFIRESDNIMLARSKDNINVEIIDKWLYKSSTNPPHIEDKPTPFQWTDELVKKFCNWFTKIPIHEVLKEDRFEQFKRENK